MEVKNLFDPEVKREIINRINRLTPDSKPLWGKMNVSQMLAHLQVPIGVAVGRHKLKRSLFGKIMGPIARPMLYNHKPFRRALPTDKSFIMTGTDKVFETEKMNLLHMVQGFSESALVNEPHPFFGKLTAEQWSKGTWKHLDHHLQQFGV